MIGWLITGSTALWLTAATVVGKFTYKACARSIRGTRYSAYQISEGSRIAAAVILSTLGCLIAWPLIGMGLLIKGSS
jgi:hypothetical protein